MGKEISSALRPDQVMPDKRFAIICRIFQQGMQWLQREALTDDRGDL
jgi:hypothetical protein